MEVWLNVTFSFVAIVKFENMRKNIILYIIFENVSILPKIDIPTYMWLLCVSGFIARFFNKFWGVWANKELCLNPGCSLRLRLMCLHGQGLRKSVSWALTCKRSSNPRHTARTGTWSPFLLSWKFKQKFLQWIGKLRKVIAMDR